MVSRKGMQSVRGQVFLNVVVYRLPEWFLVEPLKTKEHVERGFDWSYVETDVESSMKPSSYLGRWILTTIFGKQNRWTRRDRKGWLGPREEQPHRSFHHWRRRKNKHPVEWRILWTNRSKGKSPLSAPYPSAGAPAPVSVLLIRLTVCKTWECFLPVAFRCWHEFSIVIKTSTDFLTVSHLSFLRLRSCESFPLPLNSSMGNKPLAKLRPAELDYFHRCTNFSNAEIGSFYSLSVRLREHAFVALEEWYKCFHKDCPTGQLTYDDFKKIYAQFFPAGDSSDFAEHVFRRFDTDRNQQISFREFLTALSITSKGKLEDKLDWAFGLYDTNEDGFITKDEMLHIVTVSVDGREETCTERKRDFAVL